VAWRPGPAGRQGLDYRFAFRLRRLVRFVDQQL
jgi:hypothetical protein